MMGYASAIVRHPSGDEKGAADPRGDSSVRCAKAVPFRPVL
jgi:hypothetical protein